MITGFFLATNSESSPHESVELRILTFHNMWVLLRVKQLPNRSIGITRYIKFYTEESEVILRSFIFLSF